MADIAPTRFLEPVTKPSHYVAPTNQELRAQSIHRLQVGLVGLCTMLLLVVLANVIMDRAQGTGRDEPVEEVIAADNLPKKPASDPLADIGVVPSADPTPVEPVTPIEPAEKMIAE